MADPESGKTDLGALADGGPSAVVDALKRLPIAIVGRTTCPFCLEAVATLTAAAANVGGADAVSVFWVDKLEGGGTVFDALKKETGQKTVPYNYVNGELLGGCDDLKKLQAAGSLAPKLAAAAVAHGLTCAPPRKPVPSKAAKGAEGSTIATDSAHGDDRASAGSGHGAGEALLPDDSFVDLSLKPATGDDTPPAPLCLFWFPEVVDSNVIRLTAIQVVVCCILGIVWRTHTWAHYLILGLAVDGVGRVLFGPGPSPIAQVARCGAAFMTPKYRPGVPKQFAAACGTFMATAAAVFMFTSGYDPEEFIASCILGMYAALAFLEASIDFCMGCVMFGWAVKFGMVPPTVYSVGIAAKPEAEYTYEEAVKRLDLPDPQPVRLHYPGKPPSAVDIRYKTKLNDHDRQSFNVLKHTKIAHFNAVLGLCGLAVVWRAASLPAIGGAAGLSVSNTVGDVLTIIAVAAYCLMCMLYLAKACLHANKVCKEWFCPLRSNSFVIPPAALVLIAFCTAGRFDNATTLAKVLFWIDAPITLALALWLGARWITDPHSQEHINPATLMPATACFVCALVAPFLDPAHYTEPAFLWFSVALALALPLYVITFQRALLFNEPDDRQRLLKWTWVAAPAVACAAQVVLNAATGPAVEIGGQVFSGAFSNGAEWLSPSFTFASRMLYFIALGLGLMLGALFLTGHASRLKFDMSSWALGFPLDALAIATLMYAGAVPGILTNGMACAALAVASLATLVLSLHSLHSLLMGGIFVMDPKYGPLSQQILTHEAFRASGERLKAAAAALEAGNGGAVNAAALADFALQFRRYRLAHHWHANQEGSVIFPMFETYAPGLTGRSHNEHAEDEAKMERWAGLVEAAEGAVREGAGEAGAQALAVLHAEIPAFIDAFENHLRGEEEHLQRVGRKQLNLDLQKEMLRKIWDNTPPEVWAEYLPWTVANLPMHQQRVKFVRCWAVWVVPERAQLIGRWVALGVDQPTWERLAASVPEVVPRGASGWRRYF
ncbi:C4-dicarboxylate ABC transporter [Micractinium conductrix]|uniref:C4-dicarboxylate ABC transporter n=1 Tax=Micractinium conductrix TaxID=554055 RepID=A0A2P6VB83_9CHLO|nr:C4-dicarboxylate ABC transporter [Micractinium conductrix]|eukprot:PSC71350.1 C4-dicarboxylate ABC transporter [Micractinium conductrix]